MIEWGMALAFCGPFLLLAAIPLLHAVHPVAPLLSVVALLTVLLAGERWRDGPQPHAAETPRLYRALPWVYIPTQLAVTAWATMAAGQGDAAAIEMVALLISTGVMAGVFGMLTAHEMVHSHHAGEIALGVLMLTGMTYRHFRIAHIYGHHRWAGTHGDAGTARLGESAYRFIGRTVVMQAVQAWRFETRRTRRRGLGWWRHRGMQDVVVYAALYGAVYAVAGWRGILFFLGQSAVAIIVLELFNYIAHYGLMRRERDGRLEPFTDRHSWNTSSAFANRWIFNMGRHSDHHRRPAARFEQLRPLEGARELPAGYAGSILLAFVPPLWRRLMDPLITR